MCFNYWNESDKFPENLKPIYMRTQCKWYQNQIISSRWFTISPVSYACKKAFGQPMYIYIVASTFQSWVSISLSCNNNKKARKIGKYQQPSILSQSCYHLKMMMMMIMMLLLSILFGVLRTHFNSKCKFIRMRCSTNKAPR